MCPLADVCRLRGVRRRADESIEKKYAYANAHNGRTMFPPCDYKTVGFLHFSTIILSPPLIP